MASFTRGLSFHHETNASSQPTINNNISINATNELSNSTPSIIIDSGEDKQEQKPIIEVSSIERENQFLKKVLELFMSQKVYWSDKFIILKSVELLELIHILLPDKAIRLNSEDIEIKCCGASQEIPYNKVQAIWVDEGNGSHVNLKYQYSNIVSLLEQYRISIKYVRDN